MNAPVPVPSLERFVRAFWKTLGRLMQEKAHAQVTISLRDGKVTLVEVRRTYQPENLPDQ